MIIVTINVVACREFGVRLSIFVELDAPFFTRNVGGFSARETCFETLEFSIRIPWTE